MTEHRVETIDGPVWLDEEPRPLTPEEYEFLAALQKERTSLKAALQALSIIASMGDHHSRTIAMKAIEAIGASDA